MWRLVDGKKQPGEVSFIGMAPAEKPRFVIAVFVPAAGAAVAANPAFRDMMQFTLRHYRVPPSRSGSAPKFVVYRADQQWRDIIVECRRQPPAAVRPEPDDGVGSDAVPGNPRPRTVATRPARSARSCLLPGACC